MFKRELQLNQTYIKQYKIEDKDTASKMGSGNLDVLSTPALVAYMENSAMLCVKSNIAENFDTVGTYRGTSRKSIKAV